MILLIWARLSSFWLGFLRQVQSAGMLTAECLICYQFS